MWQNKDVKRIIIILFLSLASSAYALPNCPSDQNQRYDNCFGTYAYPDGEKYVGEWKDDKMYGQGTYTFASGDKYAGEYKEDKRHGQGTYTFVGGRKEVGYFMNGDFVPEICEGMGLSKGTSGYEQCVLKLIDKL